MRKRIALKVAIALSSLILAAWTAHKLLWSNARSLSAAIADASKSDGAVIDLKAITDFDWDKVYIFPPYTAPDQIERAIGFSWSGAADARIKMHDSVVLLLFVNGQKVVCSLHHPRDAGDFSSAVAGEPHGLSAEEAKFRVQLIGPKGSEWPRIRRLAGCTSDGQPPANNSPTWHANPGTTSSPVN